MKTIGGSIFGHNCIAQDYCLSEALQSLLPICDEIVYVDAESTDGTLDMVRELANAHPKIEVLQALWSPVAGTGGAWLADLANMAREALSTDYHFGLQADEVLFEEDYETMDLCASRGTVALCNRLNFWIDHHHICPPGVKVGHRIIRAAPRHLPFVGDAEGLRPNSGEEQLSIRIFHYGFIRKFDQFVDRSIRFQDEWHGFHDPVLDKMRAEGRQAYIDHLPPEKLLPYDGPHPATAHRWLEERGYHL